mmetsp:Transcript_3039/g.8794  ORF Transcript_3039/g.8794 Transcript_3039/m.8794 type:complete len:208 (-) Transcript_3039:744-1367(-)
MPRWSLMNSLYCSSAVGTVSSTSVMFESLKSCESELRPPPPLRTRSRASLISSVKFCNNGVEVHCMTPPLKSALSIRVSKFVCATSSDCIIVFSSASRDLRKGSSKTKSATVDIDPTQKEARTAEGRRPPNINPGTCREREDVPLIRGDFSPGRSTETRLLAALVSSTTLLSLSAFIAAFNFVSSSRISLRLPSSSRILVSREATLV